MAKSQVKLTWLNVDPDTLSTEQKKLYTAVKAAFEATKTAKAAFETAMTNGQDIPAGKHLVVSYLRGLAFALADDDKGPAKGAVNAKSLFKALSNE